MRLSETPTRTIRASGMAILLLLASCSTYCGIGVYCTVPQGFPLSDTFKVVRSTNTICIGGRNGGSCYSEGVYQSGTRTVEFYSAGDDGELHEPITALPITGKPGEVFRASCFEYNGGTRFGLTEVLIGIEVRRSNGTIESIHPSHTVTRRDTIVPMC